MLYLIEKLNVKGLMILHHGQVSYLNIQPKMISLMDMMCLKSTQVTSKNTKYISA